MIIKPATATKINAADPLAKGLVGAWLFNEGGGTVAYDYSLQKNHGTLVSGPTWITTQFGRALNLDGTNDEVVIGTAQTLNGNDLTAIALIRLDTFSGGGLARVIEKNNGSDFGYSIDASSAAGNTLRFYSQNGLGGAVAAPTNSLQTGVWYVIGATYVEATKKCVLYINGTTVASGTLTGGLGDHSAIPLTLGGRSTDTIRQFDGQFVYAYLYNRELSPSEVRSLYVNPYRIFEKKRKSYKAIAASGSVGSSSGTGTATATGQAIYNCVGSAVGTGVATAIGRAIKNSVGSAVGTGVASATGASIASAVGSASGIGASIGVSPGGSTGVAAGVGTASSIGSSIWSAVGSSSSTGAAASTGAATKTGVGNAAATGSAAATGLSLNKSVGSAAGIGSSSAVSTAPSQGAAAGVGSAISVGASLARAIGSASANGILVGAGVAGGVGVGSSSGVGTASASGKIIWSSAGTASGIGAAAAASHQIGLSTRRKITYGVLSEFQGEKRIKNTGNNEIRNTGNNEIR